MFSHIVILHVEGSGIRVRRESAGKKRESHWILQESTGNHWKMEAVFSTEKKKSFSRSQWGFHVLKEGFVENKDHVKMFFSSNEAFEGFPGKNTKPPKNIAQLVTTLIKTSWVYTKPSKGFDFVAKIVSYKSFFVFSANGNFRRIPAGVGPYSLL